MTIEERQKYGEDLFQYLNKTYPAFAQTKNQNATFHFDWPDAVPFISFLHRVLEYDTARMKDAPLGTVLDLYGLFIILRSVGIGLFEDPTYGFVIKPFIGTNPSNESGFSSIEEYENYKKEYLMPHAEWLTHTLKSVADSLS